MFESILPQGSAPANTPQLPPNLLALINGAGPVTSKLAMGMASTPPAPNGPMNPAMPLGAAAPPVVPSGPGIPKPSVPVLPPGGGLPLPSPTEAAFDAAGRGAAAGQVFDSPFATLASSLARGLQAGLPAFRAQKQANKEAEYAQSVANARQKSLLDYVNNNDNFNSFGVKGKNLQGALRAMVQSGDTAGASKLLQDNQLWQPPKISSFGGDGLYNESTGEVVKQATTKVSEGESLPLVDPATGKQRIGDDGQPMFYTPNPKPLPTSFDKLDNNAQLAGLSLFGERIMKGMSQGEAKAIHDMVEGDKLRNAVAGRTPAADALGAELGKNAVTRLGTEADTERLRSQSLPMLYDARNLLATGDVNTGITAGLHQQWARLTGQESAEDTQRFMSNVMLSAFPELKPTFGGQFSKQETEMFMKAHAGDLSQQKDALTKILDSIIARNIAPIQEHNKKAAELTAKYPGVASQFLVPVPNDPYAKVVPPTVPPGVTVQTDPASGRKYFVDPKTNRGVYIDPASTPQ